MGLGLRAPPACGFRYFRQETRTVDDAALVQVDRIYYAALPAAQEPTFKAGTRTVAVYATVTGADGTSHRYAVTSNESLNKQVVPLADLFVRDGPAQLVLVSCGGAYVKEQGGYLDNVVLRAVKL